MSLFGFILTFSYKPTVSEPCTSMFFNPVHWDLPCMFKAMFRQQANPTQRHDHSSHSQVTKHSLSQCDSTDWCSHTALLAAAWTLLSHSVAHSISLDSALCVSLPVTQKKHFEIPYEHPDWDTQAEIWSESHLRPPSKWLGSNLKKKKKLKSIWIHSKTADGIHVVCVDFMLSFKWVYLAQLWHVKQ